MTPGARVVILSSPSDRDFWANRYPFNGWGTVAERPIDDDPWNTSIRVHFDEIPENNTYSFPAAYVFTLYVIEEQPG